MNRFMFARVLFDPVLTMLSIAHFIYGKYGKADAQQLPLGVPRVFIRVIDRGAGTVTRCAP
jgi:hypothetical protein